MENLSDRNRGQLLLVTGFALAVAFVGLALVLNSVIYTENLATRSESTTTSDAISHARAVEGGTADVIEYINEHNTTDVTTYPSLEENLTRGVDNISDVSQRHQLNDGQVTNDTVASYYEGTWIKQTNENEDFRNDNGAADWVPVNTSDGAKGARSLRIFVGNPSSLPDSLSNGFNVTATDSSNVWELKINDTDVQYTDANGNSNTCPHSGTAVWVNVSGGRVDNATCSGLDFGGDLDTIKNVTFRNADEPTGTYRLLVNTSEEPFNTGNVDYGSSSDGPYTEPAVYGAKVRVTYERRTLSYENVLEVVPGEKDE